MLWQHSHLPVTGGWGDLQGAASPKGARLQGGSRGKGRRYGADVCAGRTSAATAAVRVWRTAGSSRDGWADARSAPLSQMRSRRRTPRATVPPPRPSHGHPRASPHLPKAAVCHRTPPPPARSRTWRRRSPYNGACSGQSGASLQLSGAQRGLTATGQDGGAQPPPRARDERVVRARQRAESAPWRACVRLWRHCAATLVNWGSPESLSCGGSGVDLQAPRKLIVADQVCTIAALPRVRDPPWLFPVLGGVELSVSSGLVGLEWSLSGSGGLAASGWTACVILLSPGPIPLLAFSFSTWLVVSVRSSVEMGPLPSSPGGRPFRV